MEYLGWIKLHRKLLSWEWYSNLNVRVTFLHLLLMANFEDKMWQGTLIKRGSFITSYKNLSKEIGISEMQIRSALKKLILTNEITIKTTNKYTVVSIFSYDLYQTDNKQNNKQQTNKKQTSNKQITTTKESKENKEDKEDNNSFDKIKTEINNYETIFGTEIIEEFTNYWFSIEPKNRNKKLRVETQTNFDVKKRLQTWINKKTDIDIKTLSRILKNSESYKSNFATVYKGLDYEKELISFYQHRMKQAKLNDSVKEYASHFFNYLKTK